MRMQKLDRKLEARVMLQVEKSREGDNCLATLMEAVAIRSFPGRGHSRCEGPEAGVTLKGGSERE